VKNEEFHQFYCSLCGALVILSSSPLECLFWWLEDNSYILEWDKMFHKKYLTPGEQVVMQNKHLDGQDSFEV